MLIEYVYYILITIFTIACIIIKLTVIKNIDKRETINETNTTKRIKTLY